MRERKLNPVYFMSQQLNSYWYKKKGEGERGTEPAVK